MQKDINTVILTYASYYRLKNILRKVKHITTSQVHQVIGWYWTLAAGDSIYRAFVDAQCSVIAYHHYFTTANIIDNIDCSLCNSFQPKSCQKLWT